LFGAGIETFKEAGLSFSVLVGLPSPVGCTNRAMRAVAATLPDIARPKRVNWPDRPSLWMAGDAEFELWAADAIVLWEADNAELSLPRPEIDWLTTVLFGGNACCDGVVSGVGSLPESSDPESFALGTMTYAAARIVMWPYTCFQSSAISCVERPEVAVSITVRPSIIEAA
jgi:hypothetical protein